MFGEMPANASTQPVPWYQSIAQTAAQLTTAYLTAEQQRDLLRIQTQRAAQGLPPLDVSQYTPGVSVGLETGTRNTLLMVAAAAGLVFLLGKAFK